MADAGTSLDNPITLDSDSDEEGEPCTTTTTLSTRPQQQQMEQDHHIIHERSTTISLHRKPAPKHSVPTPIIRNPYLKKTRIMDPSSASSSPRPTASQSSQSSSSFTTINNNDFDNDRSGKGQMLDLDETPELVRKQVRSSQQQAPPPGKAKPPALVTLNSKQQACLDAAKNGQNVFVTGPAGTGKSIVLQQMIQYFESTYKDKEWVVTAPTGTCAVALGGQTIHSYAGCGRPMKVEDFDKAWAPERREKWKKLKVLLIDEISMCSGEFLDCLSNVVSKIRKRIDLPFGGIQLIFCGDFLQLPPIPVKERDVEDMVLKGRVRREELFLDRGFAFQAEMWKKAEFSTFILDQVFRQSNREFISVLHKIREGHVAGAKAFLDRCLRPLPERKDGIRPTILYAKNKNVTTENNLELRKLPGNPHIYKAYDRVVVSKQENDKKNNSNNKSKIEKVLRNQNFFQSCMAQTNLELKMGAQVMLIKNESTVENGRQALVNGSRGKIIGFVSELPKMVEAQSYGGGTDALEEFEAANKRNPLDTTEKILYPKVLFRNGEERVVGPVVFDSRLPGLGRCIRIAIPLKLAYAVTIHKSQGMTLDLAKVDLHGCFTEAQVYVALSRASSEDGLEIRNFQASQVRADRRALAFYAAPQNAFPHWINKWNI